MMKKPNIILIQTDQQSADTLGVYGNPIVKTPHLERLAQNGVVFDNAFCNYPACSPSRSSMMTGRYASTIRCHANHMLINPLEVSLPQVLKENDYQTALIGKNHAFMENENAFDSANRQSTLHEVFDYIKQGHHGHLVEGYENDPEAASAHQWAVDHCWRSPLGHGVNPASYEKCGTQLLGDSAIDYLENVRQTHQPFFMWLSFPDPHTPYQVPEPYGSMYDLENVPLPPRDDLKDKPERQKVAHIMDAMDKADDDLIRRVRAIHYGMINFIDDNVGRVMETLERLRLKEDTVVIFTSDHGDSMGAHGLIQKHNAFYDSFTHVPLIVTWPGKISPQSSKPLVELVDLMPTLLELSGSVVPHGVQGRSFAPILFEQAYSPREYVVIESGEEGEPMTLSEITDRPKDPFDESCFVWCAHREAWLGKGKSIRTHDWKLNIYTNGDGELYDLQNDPDELVNLFGKPEHESITVELERKLLRWSMQQEDSLPENKTAKLQYRNKQRVQSKRLNECNENNG
ncbi:sulfatase family protein [Aureibacillus halotolerans]|uniref:Arylsulfatase A-like enzyme n=1 Tax=Aureibacillus halotolerans TaxID=1508390 RepID=A0A4R6TUI2_9BACI|nr:sulfatase-like hydrolase/transferase [Aureibacillus halotolerans]TDQ37390.1 arylsulfatase A-like enzyme [Aureibacillus halotolerans]